MATDFPCANIPLVAKGPRTGDIEMDANEINRMEEVVEKRAREIASSFKNHPDCTCEHANKGHAPDCMLLNWFYDTWNYAMDQAREESSEIEVA